MCLLFAINFCLCKFVANVFLAFGSCALFGGLSFRLILTFNFVRFHRTTSRWSKSLFSGICAAAAHCLEGVMKQSRAPLSPVSRKNGLWNARSAYPRWAAPPLILNAILVHGQWDRSAQGLRRPWLVVEAGLGLLLCKEEMESPQRESYLLISMSHECCDNLLHETFLRHALEPCEFWQKLWWSFVW